MTLNRIHRKFYPLQSDEWLETVKQLNHSELKVLYYVRSLDPYNKGISITPIKIAKDLSTEKSKMHRSTVGRALKSLDSKGFIHMELLQVHIKVNPKGFLSQAEIGNIADTQPSCEQTTTVVSPQPSVPEHNLECSQATECALRQQSRPEAKSEQGFQTPKISKTYIDFKDSLSESERENYLKFVRETIQNFRQPIQDLEAWLASQTKAGQNRWEVYYLKYQKDNKVRKPNSDSTSVPDGAKQRAIANYQRQLDQEKNGQTKTGNEVSTSEFNRLLDNPDNKIKRIDQLESQSKPITKPFGRYVSESCEHLRNLRMTNLFSNESIQGSIA
ncbi:MarR family transcriptional regulator [Pleurocapsa sp. CCALA 161]|uniref:MarR family transcriptional regulator n=1 Tax=Pleurocapsa sp. CCALA 161 TaxID=2107688 RepID=UPI000D07EEF4|nr:MarR family transcriptional regulator [Pleurocapsa sp. CCALA 161]PSB12564.1 MarR family transcriptional regulator [Pleurocapsa sp. CCALA 161]